MRLGLGEGHKHRMFDLGVDERVECVPDVWLTVYEDDVDVTYTANFILSTRYADRSVHTIVIGPNWSIEAPPDVAEEIYRKIGGELVETRPYDLVTPEEVKAYRMSKRAIPPP